MNVERRIFELNFIICSQTHTTTATSRCSKQNQTYSANCILRNWGDSNTWRSHALIFMNGLEDASRGDKVIFLQTRTQMPLITFVLKIPAKKNLPIFRQICGE